MFIYDSYRFFIKEGQGKLDDYFFFIWLFILSLPIDIILLPIEIIAFIMWKKGKRKMKYKGYELLKAIADGKIKDGTEIFVTTSLDGRYTNISRAYIGHNDIYWKDNNKQLSAYVFITGEFELIEDEIDIDSIEELEEIVEYATERNTINQLIQAVKQLKKEVKELKEEIYNENDNL